jgi:hypothetical protein
VPDRPNKMVRVEVVLLFSMMSGCASAGVCCSTFSVFCYSALLHCYPTRCLLPRRATQRVLTPHCYPPCCYLLPCIFYPNTLLHRIVT